MSGPEGTLPAFAAGELDRRRRTAQAKVAAGALGRADAEQLLRPWLALACRAGADLPEFADALADWRGVGGDAPFFREAEVRAIVADDIASLAAIRGTLAEARSRALDNAASPDPAKRARATAILSLAAAFAAPWPARQEAA